MVALVATFRCTKCRLRVSKNQAKLGRLGLLAISPMFCFVCHGEPINASPGLRSVTAQPLFRKEMEDVLGNWSWSLQAHVWCTDLAIGRRQLPRCMQWRAC